MRLKNYELLVYFKKLLNFILIIKVNTIIENESNEEKRNLIIEIQNVLQKFQAEKLDAREYYLLKSASLFRTSKYEIKMNKIFKDKKNVKIGFSFKISKIMMINPKSNRFIKAF